MAFYMLVGVSGSGKSTFAERIKHWGELEKEDVEIFSSDEIRKELYGDASIQKDHEKVFRILHKRVKEALSQGKSVVYDACNLSAKRRRAFLQEIQKYETSKNCIVIASDYDSCIENQKKRDRKVPIEVIKRQIKSFEFPDWKLEGWDFVCSFSPFHNFSLEEELEKLRSISHDNPHHSLTIGEHMLLAEKLAKEDGAPEVVAKQLNDIMTELYKSVKDVEFCIMAIGDLSYDDAPIQMGQFESDIRIAEQLEKVYFERGGGGNAWESYTAAWYMGLNHTKLDCWNRGKKGIIITMGDEPMNPYLPMKPLAKVTGDNIQGDIDTKSLYEAVTKKFDVYHIGIDNLATSFRFYGDRIKESFGKLLGQNYQVSTCQNLHKTIADMIKKSTSSSIEYVSSDVEYGDTVVFDEDGISW